MPIPGFAEIETTLLSKGCTMTNYDFTPLSRSFIGFDRMAGLIDNASKLGTNSAYPLIISLKRAKTII